MDEKTIVSQLPSPSFCETPTRINWLHITQPCRCRGLGRSAEKQYIYLAQNQKIAMSKNHITVQLHILHFWIFLGGFQVGCLSSFWLSYVIILTYSTSTSLHDNISAAVPSDVQIFRRFQRHLRNVNWYMPRLEHPKDFPNVVVGKITGENKGNCHGHCLGISWRNMVSFGNADADDAPDGDHM